MVEINTLLIRNWVHLLHNGGRYGIKGALMGAGELLQRNEIYIKQWWQIGIPYQ